MTNRFINLEAEQVILGSCIMDNSNLEKVADILEDKHFYFEENRVIWLRFIEVARQGTADGITLKDFFANNEAIGNVGGVSYLSTLLGQASSIVSLRNYALKLVELWQKRELELLLENALNVLVDKSFGAIRSDIENEIAGLAFQESKKKTQHIEEIITDFEKEQELGLSTKFVPTGFEKLDNILSGGIYAQQLVFIGARPSIGKTSIGQNIILNASSLGKKCLFLSLEVDKKNVFLKFISNLADVANWKILKQRMNQVEMSSVLQSKARLREMGIYVNDSSFLTISQIGNIIKNQIEKQPVDLVVVDYVQIIRGEEVRNKNESQIIKENTSQLKALAKQYDVAMLALAQINRKAVEGSKQEPTVNDFKGSGGIEEDADVAIILHRDRTDGQEEGYFSNSGKLIVAKNRHGRTGEVAINFDGEFGRFTEIKF